MSSPQRRVAWKNGLQIAILSGANFNDVVAFAGWLGIKDEFRPADPSLNGSR